MQSSAAIKQLKQHAEKVGHCVSLCMCVCVCVCVRACVRACVHACVRPFTGCCTALQGDAIVRLAEMCRKLETEEEKVHTCVLKSVIRLLLRS